MVNYYNLNETELWLVMFTEFSELINPQF